MPTPPLVDPPPEIDVKRYDRQIRLWGLETQRGLQSARVLLLRVNGLCNEIAKNLVLAGVGHVCIQDPETLVESDLQVGGLFHVNKTQLGTSKADALVQGLRPLNPHGQITSETSTLGELSDEFIAKFDYVISTHGLIGVRLSPTPRSRPLRRTLSLTATHALAHCDARSRPLRRTLSPTATHALAQHALAQHALANGARCFQCGLALFVLSSRRSRDVGSIRWERSDGRDPFRDTLATLQTAEDGSKKSTRVLFFKKSTPPLFQSAMCVSSHTPPFICFKTTRHTRTL